MPSVLNSDESVVFLEFSVHPNVCEHGLLGEFQQSYNLVHLGTGVLGRF